MIHWCFDGECHGPISLSVVSQLYWSSGTCCKHQLRILGSLNKLFRSMVVSCFVYKFMCRYAHCNSELGSVRFLVGTSIACIVVKRFLIRQVETHQPCNTDYLHVAAIFVTIWIHWYFFLGFKKAGEFWIGEPTSVAMAVDSDSESVHMMTPSADFQTPVTWNGTESLSYRIPYLAKSNKILLRHLIFKPLLWGGRHRQLPRHPSLRLHRHRWELRLWQRLQDWLGVTWQ